MEPLHFPKLSTWESFMLYFPVLGTHHTLTAYANSILTSRTDEDVIREWSRVSERERNVGTELIELISHNWEVPCRFIPQDTMEVILWDHYGDSDLEFVELLIELERTYHIVITKDISSDLLPHNRTWNDVTLIEFVQYITQKSELDRFTPPTEVEVCSGTDTTRSR